MAHTFDICLASNKPDNLRAFLEHHGKHDGVTYWVVVDDKECMDICIEHGAFAINNPRPELKYYGLNHGYQAVFQQSNGEFFTILTDEIRYPVDWYNRLQEEFGKYTAEYPDRIFRLRVSDFRHKNYQGLMQCMIEPENYSINTREWMTVAEGVGEFWGPDSWHQCIEYMMGVMHDAFFPHGLRRGFPIEFFKIAGLAAGVGFEGEARKERDKRIRTGWEYYVQREYQKKYLLLAYKLRMTVFAALMKAPIAMKYSEENEVYVVSSGETELGMLTAHIPEFSIKTFDGFREIGEALYRKPHIDENLLRP